MMILAMSGSVPDLGRSPLGGLLTLWSESEPLPPSQ